MSGSIEALTAALDRNTAAINKMIEMSGGKAASSKPAAEKPAAEKPAAAKPASKPAGGKKKTTVDDVAAAFGGYLGIKDKAEREVRKGHVKSIVDYFGAAKATEIDPDNFDEALRYLQQFIDGETPEFDGGDSGDGDEDEALV